MSFGSTVKYGTTVSFLAILVAVYINPEVYDLQKWFANNNRQLSVLNGLLELEANNLVAKGSAKPRVAVGYGACLDLFVNATDLLEQYKLSGEPEHFDEIQSDDQLLKSFAYYFKHGAAAERFMSDNKLFNKWVKKSAKIPTARWALGGNAPVMASRFQKEGCEVLLAARMSNTLKSNLQKDIKVTGGSDIDKDDIHLILEYATGENWSNIKTPRANRYIVHNDQNNPTVSSLEEFGKLLPEFQPDVVIVSGLQMMDNYPFKDGVRENRLEAIKNQMISHGKQSRMHFEMASFVEERLLKNLMEYIIPYSDSLGMNEQELANLYNLYLFGEVTYVADFNPRVATALDQTRQLYKIIRNASKKIENSKKLTRLHIHTLAYQAILTEKNSDWKRSKAAAAKASLTANRHVCGSKDIDVSKAKLILDNSFSLSTMPGSNRINVTDDHPVSCWDEQIILDNNEQSDISICVAPVLVCTEAKQTAGGGDNISSAGLVLQI